MQLVLCKKKTKAHKNQDLVGAIQKLLEKVRRKRPIEFAHVKGHSGSIGNERADALANLGATNQWSRCSKRWKNAFDQGDKGFEFDSKTIDFLNKSSNSFSRREHPSEESQGTRKRARTSEARCMPPTQAPAVTLPLELDTQPAQVDPQCTMVSGQCTGMPISAAIQDFPEASAQHIAKLQAFIQKRGLLDDFKASAQSRCATQAHH